MLSLLGNRKWLANVQWGNIVRSLGQPLDAAAAVLTDHAISVRHSIAKSGGGVQPQGLPPKLSEGLFRRQWASKSYIWWLGTDLTSA